jgi:hypothetical protein
MWLATNFALIPAFGVIHQDMVVAGRQRIWAGFTLAVPLLVIGGCARQGSVASYPVVPETPAAVAQAPQIPLASSGDARDIWQLRSILNVAALGCRRAGDRALGPRYNDMLKRHKGLLAAAYAAEVDRYRRGNGARWQAVQDREMTVLYNRFANLLQAPTFCAAANDISAEALTIGAAQFAQFAAAALPRLTGSGFALR